MEVSPGGAPSSGSKTYFNSGGSAGGSAGGSGSGNGNGSSNGRNKGVGVEEEEVEEGPRATRGAAGISKKRVLTDDFTSAAISLSDNRRKSRKGDNGERAAAIGGAVDEEDTSDPARTTGGPDRGASSVTDTTDGPTSSTKKKKDAIPRDPLLDTLADTKRQPRLKPQYLLFIPRLAALNHTLPAALVSLIDFWIRSLELYYLRLMEAKKWTQQAHDLIKKVLGHRV